MSEPKPLKERGGSHAARLLDEASRIRPWPEVARRATRERIERSLHGRRAARAEWTRRIWILVPVAAALLLIVLVRSSAEDARRLAAEVPDEHRERVTAPAPEVLRVGAAIVQPRPGARVNVRDRRLFLDEGRLEARVGEPAVEFRAPSIVVVGQRTSFAMSVERAETTVTVYEGELRVIGPGGGALTVAAGETLRSDDARLSSTRAPSPPVERTIGAPEVRRAPRAAKTNVAVPAPAAVELAPSRAPASARSERIDACARLAGDARRACLAALADGQDLAAETALYALARDARAGEAIARLREYGRRFPRGVFAPEAALLLVDALDRAGAHDEATAAARSFVERFPDDPRAARVLRARAQPR
jgi:hypothetical protein